MKIINCTPDDIEEIKRLYQHAVVLQKRYNAVAWPHFSDDFIKSEIEEKQVWKLLINHRIGCVWSTAFSDPKIWLQKKDEPAIYLHRIATSPDFRGRFLVKEIVEWSKAYAKALGKAYIRMDTVGNNSSLINYYSKCGFQFLGLFPLHDTSGLPAHYHNAQVSLFEISLVR
ncbi:GNAT family N-acetyltransferase [Catalinimonas sp. 4WD22]|uniref:GNAT family N-acetyltransferase n=1 Tax=Catalinimonas locisalis TaxID=3133978 RepID=UPI003100D557